MGGAVMSAYVGIMGLICSMLMLGFPRLANPQAPAAETARRELTQKYTIEKLRLNPHGIPTYVEGDLTPAGAQGDPKAVAQLFFEQNKAAFQMQDPAQELVPRKIEQDALGMTHVYFKQTYHGVEVYGGDLAAHFSAQGRLRTVNGNYKAGISVRTTPALAQAAAEQIAATDLLGGQVGPRFPDTRVMIFRQDGADHLAWVVRVRLDGPIVNWEYFIDATTGTILHKANRLQTYR